jgi:putative membrane protein insertion efficiency factor
MIKRILLAFLRLYRDWASPVLHALFPAGCKFQPTCSEYASEAIAVHGALRGAGMALGRLLRCHPFGRGGFDPVPLRRTDRTMTAIPNLDKLKDLDQFDHGRLANAALREPLP